MDSNIEALESLPLPRTKSELLARIRPARAALDGTIRALSERQLAAPGADAGWALKDHLAHLATWEDMIAAHLRDGSDHEIVGMDADTYAAQSLDALNDAIYALHKARPVEEVIAHYARAHEHVLSVLNALDDAAFQQPYWHDDSSGRTVMEKVTGDTYRHYIEHLRWIEERVSEPGERT